MKIGLIDVDAQSRGKVTFPNLPLMKLSAWHKAQGDEVQWYSPLLSGHMDRVYMSKAFGDEYTADYNYPIDADEIIRGGSGYAITIENGKEVHNRALDKPLPPEIDHIYPDYSLYGITDTAYGFLTKGCPRDCGYCPITQMQGRASRTVADISEFWRGQRNIVLLDPNITASRDCVKHFETLANTQAYVDFSQGLDICLLDERKIEALNKIRWKRIHFAWDRPGEDMRKQFAFAAERLKRFSRNTISCYVLTNYDSTHEQDLERVMFLRSIGVQPYVMIYRKHTAPAVTRKLQRYCSPTIFWNVPTFAEYQHGR